MTEPTQDVEVADTAIAATLTDASPGKPPRVSAAEDALIGQTLAHFQIEQQLGKGGMGVVYRATDLSLDRPVAIKVLPDAVASEPTLRERFRREARAQARLRHPNICHIYFIGDDEQSLFFAMELVEGETVAERLAREGSLAANDAIEIILGVAHGLKAAQKQGFVHRDIKPSNLMVDAEGQVKILDFGLVTRGVMQPARAGAVDTTVATIGTPLYMAPEQANGQDSDFRADIYSLGVTLHHLVSGKPPYTGNSLAELLSQHATASRPLIKAGRGSPRNASVVDELCERMMAKKPEDRFSNYDELIVVLGRASERRTPSVGALNRWVAAALDVVVAVVATAALSALAPIRGEVGLVVFLVGLILYTLVAWASVGRTLGMASFRLRLVRTDASARPSWRHALGRLWWAWSYALVGLGLAVAGANLRGKAIGGAFVVAGIALILFGVVRVVLVGVWSGLRAPRGRTPWDRKSQTEVVLETAG